MIEILSPGPMTTVQDGGRNGFMRYGVGNAGAMDALALAHANILVGNAMYEGALEATLMIPQLRFTCDTLFAITGGECAPQLDGEVVPVNAAVLARVGQTLASAPMTRGCRAYIAFAGGLGLKSGLGSVSCDKKAGIGGLGGGEKLKKGDVLPNAMPEEAKAFAGRKLPEGVQNYLPAGVATLRVCDGPQAGALSKEGEGTLFSMEYTVLPESDRMGVRFSGEKLAFAKGDDGNIITDALCAGALQITGAGLPILMMADAQTTGGYAKPFWVAVADLPVAAQLRPNDRVRFARCTVEEAQLALRVRAEELERLARSFQVKRMRVKVGEETYDISVSEVFSA